MSAAFLRWQCRRSRSAVVLSSAYRRRAFSGNSPGAFSPALKIIAKGIPREHRDEYMLWQAQAQEKLDSVIGAGNCLVHHQVEDTSTGHHQDTVVVVFRNAEMKEQWDNSEKYRSWLADGEKFQQSRRSVLTIDLNESLGGWLPSPSAPDGPGTFKISCAIALAIFPTTQAMKYLVGPGLLSAVPELAQLPHACFDALMVVFTVGLMTNAGLPLSKRLLSPWFMKPSPIGLTVLNTFGVGSIFGAMIYGAGVCTGEFTLPVPL